MARGTPSSQGRTARSELSERLRAKAEELRKTNAKEIDEVNQTETEYNDVLEQQYIRLQEELAREMKDRKWSVDQQEQAKRELEAKKAEMEAEAEEAREGKLKSIMAGMKDDQDDLTKRLDSKITKEFIPKLGGGMGSNPNLYMPWDFSGDYERKTIASAPAEIKSAVRAFFEAHGDGSAGVKEAMEEAYTYKLAGKSVEGDPSKIPSTKEHDSGLDNIDKAGKYIKSILKNAKRSDLRFDEDGNERT